MLENLFQALRPSHTTRHSAVTGDAAAKVTALASRLFDAPLALVVRPGHEKGQVLWAGQGAERVLRLPPALGVPLCDAKSFSAFVVRDTRGEGRWKVHPLSAPLANINLASALPEEVRFAAAAPLRSGDKVVPGALLVLDVRPRPEWNDAQTASLCDLASLTVHLLEEEPPPAAPLPENENPVTDAVSLSRANDELRAEVAERKRSEEALRDSERLFRSVVQSASDAIVICDNNARIVAWNRGAARMFGYSEEAVLGRPLWDLLSRSAGGRREELEKLCRDEMRRAERNGDNALPPFEALGRRSAGGEFPIELSLSPWQGEQTLLFSAIIRDVSSRQMADRLRALSHAVSRILAEAPSLDEAGQGILRAIGESRAWSTGALWLIKRAPGNAIATPGASAGPVLRCVQMWNQAHVDTREIDAVRRQSAYACGVGLPGRVWAAGEPFWIEDIARDPHIPRSSALARAGLRAAMGFPIRFGHEILGVVDLYCHEPLPADTNFMEMAATFGNQVGQFIARKQVEQEIRSRARQQAAVARLGQRALSRAGLDVLLGEAVALVGSTLAVDYCSILELLPDGRTLKTRSVVGGKPGMIGEIGVAADATSQAGWTLLACEPVVVDDYRTETRFASSPLLEASGAVSGVSVAIPGPDRPFGVLMAHVAHERNFTPDDVHFLEAVANVVAAALERNQGEAALQKARDEAEAARVEAETARLEAEKAREDAERANVAKSEFLSRMSHELRTPLNAIIGFTQLLQMEELPPDQEESVQHIYQGGTHLLGLINEVLQIARIEAGRLSLSIENIVPGPLAREAMELLAPLAARRNIRMNCEACEVWNVEIRADRQRVHEVLLNYLSNAVKYNCEGGEITVSCLAVSEMLRICVTDTGPGIPADKMSRLFQPFDRLGAENSGIEGTGLGLALVKNLVEAMGGRVGAESEVGKGSVFWAEFPLWAESVPAPRAVLPAPKLETVPPAALAGRVLYIEDNTTNLRLVERVLARCPQIELVAALRGFDGLDAAHRHHLDLILLDLNLPDVPGFEVLRRLKEDETLRRVPVVIVSADANPAQQEQARALGAHGYITKPFDVRDLMRVLQETLPPVR